MPAISCKVKVLAHQTVAENIRRLTVEWTDRAHAPHAGQFFMLRAWGEQEAPFLSRPISVNCYEDGKLYFLYQVKGQGTEKIAALRPGDSLNLTGPAGNGFDLAAYGPASQVAVVGGGIGTAPLYEVCRQLAAQGVKPRYFAGFADAPYGIEAVSPLCASVQVATDSGRVGYHGFVTELLHAEQFDAVLTCGPEVMMRNVAKLCAAAGTPCFVSMEKKMACGIGACLGCTCHTAEGPRSVCKNGPVFPAKTVFPELFEAEQEGMNHG